MATSSSGGGEEVVEGDGEHALVGHEHLVEHERALVRRGTILVGTEGNAQARRGGLTGREVAYEPRLARGPAPQALLV